MPESKRAKTEEEKVIPKKLDLKKLAFMLDEDDERRRAVRAVQTDDH